MAGEAPPFWWEPVGWRARALWPAAAIYGRVAGRRMHAARRERIDAPVLCVGNFTVGGTGKTPVSVAIAQHARGMGLTPGILSRGHGGRLSHPHIVDPARDTAKLVGDEPLLLASHVPVAVTPDRAAGARLLIAERHCDFLIMDDGFQSAHIHIDYALVVVDGMRGLGNGRVLPAGPLRAPLTDQMRHADAVLRMGAGQAGDLAVRAAARAGKPVYDAMAQPRHAESFAGRRFLAFAGIGNPQKFFETLRRAGGEVVSTRAFPDHHVFTAEELAELARAAGAAGLDLVTTEKDMARLRHMAEARFLQRLSVLEIDARFESERIPRQIVETTLKRWKERRLKS